MLKFDVNSSVRQKAVKNVIRGAIREVISREVKSCVAKIESEVMAMMPRIELEVARSIGEYGRTDDINVVLKIIEREAAAEKAEEPSHSS